MAEKKAPITKITRPSVTTAIKRERLFRLLDGQDRSITWIKGPPGSGKTTLAASYLDYKNIPCAWYDLDEDDSDPASFFYYMGLAAKGVAPVRKRPLPLLTPEYLIGVHTFARRWFEELRRRSRAPFAIILDNYQNILRDSGFHDVLTSGLDAISEDVKVVVLSRAEPPASFANFRNSGRLSVIGWDEVRFTIDEAGELLSGKYEVDASTLARIYNKTEGWAAGLALMRAGEKDAGSITGQVSDDTFDYFASQVFEKHDAQVRDILLKSSFLPDVTRVMAERITGDKNSGPILNRLNRDHYFTEKHDQTGPVYRYHQLFRDFLQQRAAVTYDEEELLRLKRDSARLLEESGRIEDAAALWIEAGEVVEAARMAATHAPALLSQGRSRVVQDWISRIPAVITDESPWLLYWLGASLLGHSPAEGRTRLEKAFRLFEASGDETGTLLAWSGIIDSILYEFDCFEGFDPLIDWFDGRMQGGPAFPSPEIELRVSLSMVNALTFRRPWRSDTRDWVERALSLARGIKDVNVLAQVYFPASHYYLHIGEVETCKLLMREAGRLCRSSAIAPVNFIAMKDMEAEISYWGSATCDVSLKPVLDGIELAVSSGVHVWDDMLFGLGVYGAIRLGDLETAESFLSRLESALRPGRLCVVQFNHCAAWLRLLKGDIPGALAHVENALSGVKETGAAGPLLSIRILHSLILHEAGEHERALAGINLAKGEAFSPIGLYMARITEAYIAFGMGEEASGISALREAMSIGRRHGYLNLIWFDWPAFSTYLCVKALEAGIEVEYVRDLVLKHGYFPAQPPLDVVHWPWKYEVRTLGVFEIIKDGKTMRFEGKAPQKPLQLLKAIIAFGGRDVRVDRLTDALWPDADGDMALNNYKTTLSRLRQILDADNAVTVAEGRVTLNPRSFRVDAFAFGRLAQRVEELKDDNGKAAQILASAIDLYRGHFLSSDADFPWTTSMRERLRDNYLRLIVRGGGMLEDAGRWTEAMDYYMRATDVDGLAEGFYQRLMVCHQALGQRAEALSAYRRLEKALMTTFGIAPSRKTKEIYNRIVSEE